MESRARTGDEENMLKALVLHSSDLVQEMNRRRQPRRLAPLEEPGMQSFMTFYGMDWEERDHRMFRGLDMSASTEETYSNILDQLKHYCTLRGDHESLIVLQQKTPMKPPSMKIDTIIEFALWKRLPKGEVLQINGSTIRDALGNAILCTGAWNDPQQVHRLGSCISNLHKANGLTGPYIFRAAGIVSIYTAVEHDMGALDHDSRRVKRETHRIPKRMDL